jgi:transposase
MSRPRKYPEELIDRGVRLALESGRPVAHVARDIGLPAETLRKRVRQAEADGGLRPDLPTSEEREEIKALKRENYELRRAKEDTTHCPPRWFPGAGAGYASAACVGGLLA